MSTAYQSFNIAVPHPPEGRLDQQGVLEMLGKLPQEFRPKHFVSYTDEMVMRFYVKFPSIEEAINGVFFEVEKVGLPFAKVIGDCKETILAEKELIEEVPNINPQDTNDDDNESWEKHEKIKPPWMLKNQAVGA